MLPPYEEGVLELAEVEAMDQALAGNLVEGYDILLAGYERARDARERAEPNADELVQSYREALRRYSEQYGVRFD